MPKRHNPGGCTCCAPSVPPAPCGSVQVNVQGCTSLVVAGAPVTLSLGGATVGTDTTSLRVSVIGVSVQGGGYTSASLPAVAISGGGGTGATATPVLTAVAVSAVTLTSGGSGYTAPPSVTIAGTGSGATAFTRLTATSLASVRLGAGRNWTTGTGYPLGFSGGGGTGAAGTFDVDSNNAVTNLVLTSGGSGYTSAPSVSLLGTSAGNGIAAAATATVSGGSVTALALLAGSGYTSGTGYALGLSGGNGTGAAGTFDVVGGAVTNVAVTAGGSGYTVLPTVSFSAAGAGTNAAGTAVLTPTSVGTLTRGLGGSGYTATPTLTIDPPTSGTTATGTATLASQGVATIKVTNPGSNYTSTPTVTVAPPPSGTTAVASVTGMGTYAWFPITSTGSYTASATPPASTPWWSTTPATATASVTICANGGVATCTLVPASGYACRCTACRDAVPNSPTLTDANGTYSLIFNANFGWEVCYLLAGQAIYGAADPSSGSCNGASTGTGSVPVSYRLTCPGASGQTWKLQQFWAGCHQASDPTGVQLGGVAGTCGTGTDPNLATGGTGLSPTSSQVAGTGGVAPNACNTSASFTITNGYVNGTVAVSFP